MTRVLLVDDDAWLADLEAKVLDDAGYEVRVVPNALAAIDAVDDFQPEALILDVLLAGSTVFALLNELRSHNDTAKLPIILCTNIADQLDQTMLRDYGVVRVVDKSTMHPDDLVAAVRAALL